MRWWWVAGSVMACTSASVDEFQSCAIELTPASDTVSPGEVVSWIGTPLTELRDTRVTVGGIDAVVVSVERDDCGTCDACRVDAGCALCGPCDGADLDPNPREVCFGDPLAGTTGRCADCVETLTFEIPTTVPPGPAAVWVVNRNGISPVREVVVSELGAGGSGR